MERKRNKEEEGERERGEGSRNEPFLAASFWARNFCRNGLFRLEISEGGTFTVNNR